jgi:phenylalanyl-tRNA synthetase beta chain
MLISYNWLKKYFDTELPMPEKIAELFTFHAFEVEGIEKISGSDLGTEAQSDSVFDIKVLPDRAHYALSHRGIASELGAIIGGSVYKAKSSLPKGIYVNTGAVQEISPVSIKIEDAACLRYIGRRIEGLTVGKSPSWLAGLLGSIGQRSINLVVDATNFVMFDIGQPLHAFDADKVKGGIVVRQARVGEKITTLDGKDGGGKEIVLPLGTLVIADDEGPLAIAGVKGGARAQVTAATKAIILESANFEAASIRRTSTAVGIRNDSSKRFENALTPELAGEAMDLVTRLILGISSGKAGPLCDVYPIPQSIQTVAFSVEEISAKLGISISKQDIVDLLARLNITVTTGNSNNNSKFIAQIPAERLDLTSPTDLAEEVGRLYGYEKITPAVLSLTGAAPVNKRFYWEQKVRAILVRAGFSEVYTHTLVSAGPIEIQNPLASDKRALRADLTAGIAKALEFNAHNAPLIGIDRVRIFEIGKVFDGKSEYLSLVVAVGDLQKSAKKKKGAVTVSDEIRAVSEDLSKGLVIAVLPDAGKSDNNSGKSSIGEGIMEINLDTVIDMLPEPGASDVQALRKEMFSLAVGRKYRKISPYPFVLRDVAVFVPMSTESSAAAISSEEVLALIIEQAGDLLVRHALFDVFTKKFPDGTMQTSYAFNLVFQSDERTLSDEEVNAVMKKIYDSMSARGWQVR